MAAGLKWYFDIYKTAFKTILVPFWVNVGHSKTDLTVLMKLFGHFGIIKVQFISFLDI